MAEGIRLQGIADEFIFAALEYDFIAAMYNMMGWRGLDAGNCRRPFHRYTEEDLKDLKAKIREIKETMAQEELSMFEV